VRPNFFVSGRIFRLIWQTTFAEVGNTAFYSTAVSLLTSFTIPFSIIKIIF
jgi:hypothetical protein